MNLTRLLLITALCGCPALILEAAGQRQHFLDLRSIPRPPVSAGDGQLITGGASSNHEDDLPVTISARIIEPSVLTVGRPVVFEIKITNQGQQPIELPWVPWSIDHDRFVQESTEAKPLIKLQLSLLVDSNDTDHHMIPIAASTLEGVPTYENSIERVGPGDDATIVVASEVYADPVTLQRLLRYDQTRVNIRGAVEISRHQDRWSRPALSAIVPTVIARQ